MYVIRGAYLSEKNEFSRTKISFHVQQLACRERSDSATLRSGFTFSAFSQQYILSPHFPFFLLSSIALLPATLSASST